MQPSANAELIQAAKELAAATQKLRFAPPVTHVYNPLTYAWEPHQIYLARYGGAPKKVVFLGMNPGPFGMVQTGVPFGEIPAVRDWLKIQAIIEPPGQIHPRRPIHGFSCARSEISGQRLWQLFANRFGTAASFFDHHFVANYCPLAFLEDSGRNRTPDKLPAEEAARLSKACDAHLRRVVEILRPEWIVGIGEFATRRARLALGGLAVQIGQVLHPSPASPLANRGWAATATAQLRQLGIWR